MADVLWAGRRSPSPRAHNAATFDARGAGKVSVDAAHSCLPEPRGRGTACAQCAGLLQRTFVLEKALLAAKSELSVQREVEAHRVERALEDYKVRLREEQDERAREPPRRRVSDK